MSSNDPGLPSGDGEKSSADTSKRAWERPALRRLAAKQAHVDRPKNHTEGSRTSSS